MTMRTRIKTFGILAATFLLTLNVGLLMAGNAHAQNLPTLVLTTGAEGGGYHKWSTQSAAMCEDVVRVQVLPSTGGPENLNRLESNDANMALMQMDTLLLNAAARQISGIKVLTPMFPEQLHFIARVGLAKSSGGVAGIGATKTPVDFVTQLGGMSVAAAGGAQDTAQYISNTLKFTVVRDPGTSKDVVAKVLKGQYDVGLLTGVFPIDWLKGMAPADKNQLKFLSVPKEGVAGLNAYRPGSLSYSGFAGLGTTATPTFQVSSVLMVQDYKKGVKAEAVARYRECLYERSEDMASETGSHPAWRFIKPNSTVDNWPMWEAPAGQVQPAAPAKPAVKK